MFFFPRVSLRPSYLVVKDETIEFWWHELVTGGPHFKELRGYNLLDSLHPRKDPMAQTQNLQRCNATKNLKFKPVGKKLESHSTSALSTAESRSYKAFGLQKSWVEGMKVNRGTHLLMIQATQNKLLLSLLDISKFYLNWSWSNHEIDNMKK